MAEATQIPTHEQLVEVVQVHHDTLLSLEPMFYALLRVLRVEMPALYEEVARFVVHAQDGKPIADYLEAGVADKRDAKEAVVPTEEAPPQPELELAWNTDTAEPNTGR